MHRQIFVALATAAVAACDSVAPPAGPTGSAGSVAADVVASPTDGATQYEWIPLGFLGQGVSSNARAINNHNQVVGFSYIAPGVSAYHAFLWDNGVMQDLGTLGGLNSLAIGINDAGQVVGYANTVDGGVHAFFWEQGTMQDLGPVVAGAYPVSVHYIYINERGQVVGNDPQGGAFFWDRGVIKHLPMWAYDLNDHGQVVGLGGQNGALWQHDVLTVLPLKRATAIDNSGGVLGTVGTGFALWKGGRMEEIGVPWPRTGWFPKLLNERGHAVADGDAGTYAEVWNDDGWQNIGSLGGGRTRPTAINTQGEITGGSWAPSGARHAFVWREGIMRDLGVGNGRWSEGEAINERGVVAGFSGGPGPDVAAIWVPVDAVVASVP